MSMTRVLGSSDPVAIPRIAAGPRARVEENSAAAFFRQPFVPLFTALSVLVLVVLAIKFGRSAGLVSALWGAGGVAAGMWLRSGRGTYYDLCFGALIAVGVIAGELMGGNTYAQTTVFTLANMAEIYCAVLLARRFAPLRPTSSVKSALRLIILVGLVAPLPGAAIATAGLVMTNHVDAAASFQTWWFGHALGFSIIIPAVLAADRRLALSFREWPRVLEWGVLFSLLIAALWFAYYVSPVPVAFISLPILMIMAARLRTTGVALGLVLVAIFQITSIVLKGELVGAELASRVLLSQLNLLFAFLPFLLLGILLTERDALGQQAVQAQRRAEKASQAKSRLLANVAHEIKSPIGGIIGIGELWKGGQLDQQDPAARTEMAGMLVNTARQIEHLALDLLDVARAESGSVKYDLRPTDVTGVLEDVCRATSLRPDAQGLRFDVRGEEDAVALADSQRLTQVVANLASNAVKYGASGGEVVFRAQRALNTVRIEVSDRGPGLTPEKQTQLFEPFNRLGLERSTIEGHGIGLALAKSLIELQGGTIGVISAPGAGATFWIELPAAA